MATTARPLDDREMAIAISSSAGLELVWSAAALVAALCGVTGLAPAQPLSAVALIAVGFALLGRSGALAARWPRDAAEVTGVGTDLLGAVVAIVAGVLALAEVAPDILLPAALVALGGLLVLAAPVERRAVGACCSRAWLVANLASLYMAVAGVAAMALTIAQLSTVAPARTLLPGAVLLVATAHLVGSSALLARFVPGARA